MFRKYLLAIAAAMTVLIPAGFVAGPAAAQQLCYDNGKTFTCPAKDTAALAAAAQGQLASTQMQLVPKAKLGQSVGVAALSGLPCTAAIEGAHLNISDSAATVGWHTAFTTGGGANHVGAVCRGGTWLQE